MSGINPTGVGGVPPNTAPNEPGSAAAQLFGGASAAPPGAISAPSPALWDALGEAPVDAWSPVQSDAVTPSALGDPPATQPVMKPPEGMSGSTAPAPSGAAPGLLALIPAFRRATPWAAGPLTSPDAISGNAEPGTDEADVAALGLFGGAAGQFRNETGAAPTPVSGSPAGMASALLAQEGWIAPVLSGQGRVGRGAAGLPAGADNPLVQWALGAPVVPARAADPAAFEAALRLQGPLGFLLRQGAAPGAALAVQQLWESSVLGGYDLAAGAPVAPVWSRWGLGSARQLDALIERLTGQTAGLAALAAAPDRPSQVAAVLLRLAPEVLPRVAAGLVKSEVMLLGLGSDGVKPFLGGLMRLDDPRALPVNATALTAVASRPETPLLLAHLDAPASAGAVPLGAGLTLLGAPAKAGVLASATIAWARPEMTAGLTGPLLAQFAHAMLDAVQLGGAVPIAVSVQLPLDGGPPWGFIGLATGGQVTLGAGPGKPPVWTDAPAEARPSASLALGGGSTGDTGLNVFGAHVTYDEHRAVPLDLAPVVAAVPAWRLDDTQVFAAVEADGVGPALARARRLYQRLLGGKLLLDQIPPGHGFATWEGSPAWLGLAGICKPASLGVLPGETAPTRAEVLRAGDGSWLLKRHGGCEGRESRQGYPADATDDLGFFEDALFGLPPGAASAPPGGAAGAFAALGFRHAQARMMAGDGDCDGRARTAEAWGMAARAWAGALERMARTGASHFAARGAASAQAGALREVAAWCGAIPAWYAARAAGIDRAALLAAVNEADRTSLAHALAPGAVLACLLGEERTGAPDPAAWPMPARMLATGDRSTLADWGTQALAQASEGRPDTLGLSDALALAAQLGRMAE